MKSNLSTLEDETRVHIFVQQMLMSRVFIASFVGRFYVEELKSYRDAIRIHHTEEDVIYDINIAKKRLEHLYRNTIWTSITGSEKSIPGGHCLWVNLHNVALGTYWFMIENVIFSDNNEMEIKVRVIREVEGTALTPNTTDESQNFKQFIENVCSFIGETLTWANFKESTKFIFLLLMTLGTAALHALRYLGDFSIRFFREFNQLVKVSTPIVLAILDMITKAIGGFYILIAMLWRERGGIPPQVQIVTRKLPPMQYRAIEYTSYQRKPQL